MNELLDSISFTEVESDWYDTLNPVHKSGLEDLKNGESFSHEQVQDNLMSIKTL